jgi:hypothetical protein
MGPVAALQRNPPLGQFLSALEQHHLASTLHRQYPGANLPFMASAIQEAQQGQYDSSLLVSQLRAQQFLAGQHTNPIASLQNLQQDPIFQEIPFQHTLSPIQVGLDDARNSEYDPSH